MVKLSGSISRKVPIENVPFSSQSYSAGMEVEVSDADDPDVIRERIRQLYTLLSQSIDEQIAGSTAPTGNTQHQAPPPVRRYSQPQNSQAGGTAPAPARAGNGAGRGTNRAPAAPANGGNGRKIAGATDAQCRAIYAICKSLNIDMAAFLADYNVTDPSQLHVKTASQIIDDLKSRQGNGSAPARQ